MSDLSKDLPRVTDLPRTAEKKSARTTIVDIAPKDDVPAMDAVVGGAVHFGIGHGLGSVLNITGRTTSHSTTVSTTSMVNGILCYDSAPDF